MRKVFYLSVLFLLGSIQSLAADDDNEASECYTREQWDGGRYVIDIPLSFSTYYFKEYKFFGVGGTFFSRGSDKSEEIILANVKISYRWDDVQGCYRPDRDLLQEYKACLLLEEFKLLEETDMIVDSVPAKKFVFISASTKMLAIVFSKDNTFYIFEYRATPQKYTEGYVDAQRAIASWKFEY